MSIAMLKEVRTVTGCGLLMAKTACEMADWKSAEDAGALIISGKLYEHKYEVTVISSVPYGSSENISDSILVRKGVKKVRVYERS